MNALRPLAWGLAVGTLAGCANGVAGTSGEGSDAPGGSIDGPGIPDPGETEPEVPCHQIAFTYEDPIARTVWVTGTWSGWAETPRDGARELARDADGVWTLTTFIDPPGRHEYKLIVDGARWITDPTSTESAPDGFGGRNSVLRVCEGTTEPPPSSCGGFDWQDTVMYFAMVDRFHDSDGLSDPVPDVTDGDARWGPSGQYEGGDLRGVEQKLGYLADLGVTALWLSAPFENRDWAGQAIDPWSDPHTYSGYHGYWPSPENVDYSDPTAPSPRPRVESRIGDDDDLRSLVDTAHRTESANGDGIKVLFDYVMNHVDVASGLYGAHPEWFARRGDGFALCGPENLWEDSYWGTRCAFTDYLPPFEHDNDWARRWSIDDAVWWATEYGIDGYRLDAIKHVPRSWLTELRAAMSAAVPEPAGDRFYMVGETFSYDDRGLLSSFVDPSTMLDGQFDFPFKARLCEAVFTEWGRLDDFAGWMHDNDDFYAPGALMSTWIGNHDVPRAIHFASRQIASCREGSNSGNGWSPGAFRQPTDAAPYERLGVAFAVMMTNPGVPLVYYGDEIGLAGGGDPDNRRMMPWHDAELNAHQLALRDRVGALASIRGEHPAIGRGRRETVSSDQETWVYRMVGCDESVTVAINKSDWGRDVSIPEGAYVDLLSGDALDGGTHHLGARSFVVLGPR